MEAAEYFEGRGLWDAVSQALNGAIRHAIYLGKVERTREISEKLLTVPNLTPRAWADAVSTIVVYYCLVGDYANCITSAQEIFTNLKPGQPIAALGSALYNYIYAAFTCGRWNEAIQLRAKLDEIRELLQYDHLAAAQLMKGYITLLWIASAREDRPLIDAMAAVVRKYSDAYGPNFIAYAEAFLVDDFHKFTLDLEHQVEDVLTMSLFQFYGEHGQLLPTEFSSILSEVGQLYGGFRYFINIALALSANDDARLAQAIDEAEKHQHIVHAARMRIVLAQRTGDRSQLERARPVLERLGDRLHLRRLEEVELGLQSGQ